MEESSHNSGKNYYRHSGSNNEGGFVRKGPWKPDEDQVLVNHVKKYGPRDWSSIRSKGLLQRTGKSCRLRWVNKLRPNLKNGCKFTAEEERVVIELQAQLGNKWATIATQLAGRTDNDVKNFWSSRQKRLARILQSQSSHSHKRQKTSSSSGPATRERTLLLEAPKSCLIEGETSTKAPSSPSSPYTSTSTDALQMITLPDFANPGCLTSEANDLVSFRPIPINMLPYSNELQQLEMTFPTIPPLQTELPFPPETQELIDRFDSSFLRPFGCTDEPALVDDGLQLLSCCGGGELCGQTGIKRADDNLMTPDGFFDDFPADMFDQIEPLPSPSSW